MGKTQPGMTKTCSGCGMRKPLSAFLQISATEGTGYTNICSDCRKAGITGPKKQERDDSTTSDTQHTIDTKSKVKSESDKRNKRKQVEERYFEDREKSQDKTTKVIEKQHVIVKGEKKHRDDYIKKKSFLDSSQRKTSVEGKNVHGSVEQTSQAEKFDLTAPVQDTQIAGKIKQSGQIFNQFKTWLGKSSPITGRADATQGDKQPTPEDLKEYINKNWGPGSRKR